MIGMAAGRGDIRRNGSQLTATGAHLGGLLAKLHARGSALNNRALRDSGLRERTFSVLTLACSGLEPTQRELAEFLGLDPSQIVSLVDDLEKRGLVDRITGKQDRRAKIIASTTEGRRIHSKARAALTACEQEQLASLNDEEAAQLKALLRKALWG